MICTAELENPGISICSLPYDRQIKLFAISHISNFSSKFYALSFGKCKLGLVVKV